MSSTYSQVEDEFISLRDKMGRTGTFRVRIFRGLGLKDCILVENTEMDGLAPSTFGNRIAQFVWGILLGFPHCKTTRHQIRYIERDRGPDAPIQDCAIHLAGIHPLRVMVVGVDRKPSPVSASATYKVLGITDTRRMPNANRRKPRD